MIGIKHFGFALLMCVTLGLAPFMPEPHLLGKLRWIAGGANGMAAMDWFDAVLHGAPWIFLIGLGVAFVVQRLRPRGAAT